VDIEIESTMLDRSSESEPPPERDEVTGLPYLVRVQKDQTPEEQASLMMKPGETVKSKSFTLTVIEIQEPRYVETK